MKRNQLSDRLALRVHLLAANIDAGSSKCHKGTCLAWHHPLIAAEVLILEGQGYCQIHGNANLVIGYHYIVSLTRKGWDVIDQKNVAA